MTLKKTLIVLLALLLLFSCGCSVEIVKLPTTEGSAPAISDQSTPEPTAAPAAVPTAEPSPEPTPETAPPEPTPEYSFEGYQRGLTAFGEMEYIHPDIAAVSQKIEAIRVMIGDGTSGEEILAAYDALEEDFIHIASMYGLASIYSAIDVNDEYYKNEVETLTEEYDELAVLCTVMEVEIYESEHCDVVFHDWTEEDFAYLRIAEQLYDEEYVRLDTRLTELVNAYWDASTNTTFQYQGQELTLSDLDTLEVDEDTYYELLNEYYRCLNETVGTLYLELISIEKQIAAKAGYDNFAEFSYEFQYERDYSPEDAQQFAQYVKTYVPDQMRALYSGFTYEEYQGFSMARNSRNQLDRRQPEIEAFISEVSPEMREAYDYLVEYQLSVITDSETSQNGAYSTYLEKWDVPFIYLHESGGYTDVLTFIHEFGHFYGTYVGGSDSASHTSLDVDEIRSQAAEQLFLPYLERAYGTDAYRGIMKYQMFINLSTIIDGCIYDEFQQYVFSHDVQTVEELNRIFADISRSYGIGDDYYVIDLEYVWVDVLHNFECPMYYISYATSIIPALEIMQLAQTDRAEAIRVYNSIVRSDPFMGFKDTLAENGLKSPFEEQAIIDVVNAVVDVTGIGSKVGIGD